MHARGLLRAQHKPTADQLPKAPGREQHISLVRPADSFLNEEMLRSTHALISTHLIKRFVKSCGKKCKLFKKTPLLASQLLSAYSCQVVLSELGHGSSEVLAEMRVNNVACWQAVIFRIKLNAVGVVGDLSFCGPAWGSELYIISNLALSSPHFLRPFKDSLQFVMGKVPATLALKATSQNSFVNQKHQAGSAFLVISLWGYSLEDICRRPRAVC